jgi:retinol dehydrogenase-12
LWAATSPDVVSGMYYEPVGVPGRLSASAQDEKLLKRLHEWTNDALSAIKSLK